MKKIFLTIIVFVFYLSNLSCMQSSNFNFYYNQQTMGVYVYYCGKLITWEQPKVVTNLSEKIYSISDSINGRFSYIICKDGITLVQAEDMQDFLAISPNWCFLYDQIHNFTYPAFIPLMPTQ